MCGICGKLVFSGGAVDRKVIGRMVETLRHRGPDDQGVYTEPGVGLGQARLSIIDLSKCGTPPLSNEDGTIWTVFNGEIYNYQELRGELQKSGHAFRTATDTEVLVHLYEEHGAEFVRHLRGMFAIVIWDRRQKVIFGARDRLGKKPLFYARTGTGLTFGSEIKAITADPAISVAPDFHAIDQYLTFQYVPPPLTAFDGIRKLPAGHYFTCDAKGEFRIERYWSPPPLLSRKSAASSEELEYQILETLRDSVRVRLRSDVPLGAFLSGGIDSSAIVALMAGEASGQVKTFSIGFTEDNFNELPFARLVAERYATDHHEFIVRPKAVDALPELVWHYNEPFADSSAVPTYYVSKMTRQHVTVAMTGDGGDESFAGYGRYGEQLRFAGLQRTPAPLLASIRKISELMDRLPHERHLARLGRLLYLLGSDLPDRYRLRMMCFMPQERRAAYSSDFLALCGGQKAPTLTDGSEWTEGVDSLDWMMQDDQEHYLPDCLMVKADIASMANSLEVRSPFLDHVLVECAASVPSSLKRSHRGGKLILKRALRALVPPEVLQKPKTGFGVPIASWLRGELKGLLCETLLGDTAYRRGLFNRSFVSAIAEEHIAGKRDWSTRLWALLFLELWFRRFID